jgi:hypothetical protein
MIVDIPKHFFSTYYDGGCYPGAQGVSGLSKGANCQQFAYELVRYFGKQVPDFRSSELWEDEFSTFRVNAFERLDLVLYNYEDYAWGAHVAVFLGEGRIIHLSKELIRPVIWRHEEFLNTPRYHYFIGAKRIRGRVSGSLVDL